ncbi:MAG: twin-arginine translocase TatA/TatE family subunit [bacterium]|nr:twin-arginine translocase TatA/TatE family subunit [bacterium]
MSISPIFAMFGMPGGVELIIIGAIILLLFGHRLPGIMRSLGRGATEFKKGLNDTEPDEDDEAIEATKEKQA